MTLTKDRVIETLKQVYDPEIQVDVWTMGLIYDIQVQGNAVRITMTLTTPMCPYGPMLLDEIKSRVKEDTGADVHIDVTFEPPWKPSEELRMMLGV
ncbi:MAG TPA: metal-sulfur cluster assembly factor [Candidatus Nanoarchaeia archaeon]|nr:metal-sulfur cluster assembly factor [Candidatus Nanoarchaeia archaeon]